MERCDILFLFVCWALWSLIYWGAYYKAGVDPEEEKIEIASTLSAPPEKVVFAGKKREGSVVSREMDYMTSFDKRRNEILEGALTGPFITQNGELFYFGSEGRFYGYLDEYNPETDNAYYELVDTDEHVYLRIYSEELGKTVMYTLAMDGESGFKLTYEPSGTIFFLEKK